MANKIWHRQSEPMSGNVRETSKVPRRRAFGTNGENATMIMSNDPYGMNNKHLAELIHSIGTDVKGDPGFWEFTVAGRRLYCITDETQDRMRVMTPIAEKSSVTDEQLLNCMAANYDRALDARYCLHEGTVWGAFMHPLSCLQGKLFCSACNQVAEVANNFGGSYSSGELRFGE